MNNKAMNIGKAELDIYVDSLGEGSCKEEQLRTNRESIENQTNKQRKKQTRKEIYYKQKRKPQT